LHTFFQNGAATKIAAGWRAALSAPKSQFNMKWSLAGGHEVQWQEEVRIGEADAVTG